ncbi:Protein WHAT'S THIS FACTOR 9, mitochondrial [Linum perenne]
MLFLFRRISNPRRSLHHRTLVDFAAIKHVRDRGFDHAVERENHLKPLIHLKNLIKSEPAKSLPLPVISQHRDSLQIPIRPIEFIRKYPSVFEEFLPGGLGIHPHIKLTQQVIDLDAEEQLVYQSQSYKKHVADRLVKLVMLSRIDKIPLNILDSIKWDLGLPDDYAKTIVPEFPDYFRVVGNKNSLELVCWSDELAVSLMEKRAKTGGKVYEKGTLLSFQMKFSEGFEMDKKVKNWFQEWQKLPYISPYENATHLGSNTDDADKWAVGVLHELLNLFVSKKAEREVLLSVGEWLGIRSWFKRALIQHPGIFYVSGKMGTYTVVLKEGYKRGWLVEKNELVDIRNRYMHLMHLANEDRKETTAPAGRKKERKKTTKQPELKDGDEENAVTNPNESELDDEVAYDDDEEEDDDEDEEDDEVEGKKHERGNKNAEIGKRRVGNTRNFDTSGPSRRPRTERSVDRPFKKSMDIRAEDSQRTDTQSNSDTRRPSRGPRREGSADRPYRKSMDDRADGPRRTETRRNPDMKGPSRGPRREGSVDRPYRKSTDDRPDDSRRTETRRNYESRGPSRGPTRERSDDRPYRKSMNDRPDDFKRTETRRNYDSRGPSRGPSRERSDDKPYRNRASRAHAEDSERTGTRTRSNFGESMGQRTTSPRTFKKSFADKRVA